jgi:Mn-dependent DtxR family transcriptional regulator
VKARKLSPMDVVEIKALIAARKYLRSKEIARRFGVSPSLIQSIAMKRRRR